MANELAPRFGRGSSLSLIWLVLLVSACADDALMGSAPTNGEDAARTAGQTVLFVGEDPATFETHLYLAAALTVDGTERAGLAEAEAISIEPLTQLSFANDNALLPDDDSSLYPSTAPFPVPNRSGDRIALVAEGFDELGQPVGRVGLLDRWTQELEVGPDRPGLQEASFTYGGDHLLLRGDGFSLVPLADRQESVDLAEALAVDASELSAVSALPEGETVLVTVFDGDESTVWRYDAEDGRADLLVQQAGQVREASLSPSGDFLAFTTGAYGDEDQVAVVRVGESVDDPTAAAELSRCRWPVWSPVEDVLTYVCGGTSSGSPDVVVYDAALDDRRELSLGFYTTLGESLVVRNRPLWDPTGERLVVGMGADADTLEGSGQELWSVPLDGSPLLLWDGSFGNAGWVHFSATSARGELLVWNRSHSGLQDSAGAHPIAVITTTDSPPQTVPVPLGRDLQVSYPMYLGDNTLFYP